MEYTKDISCQSWNSIFFFLNKYMKSLEVFKCPLSYATIFIYFKYLRVIYEIVHNGSHTPFVNITYIYINS
jgi:hypothetical protein